MYNVVCRLIVDVLRGKMDPKLFIYFASSKCNGNVGEKKKKSYTMKLK